MKLTNFRRVLPLIIALLVLVLTTSALALSRHNQHKNPTNRESFTNYVAATEIGLANTSPANFAPTLACALQEDSSSLIPSRRLLHRPTRYATTWTPNFSPPIRRAPIRRKGRIQH